MAGNGALGEPLESQPAAHMWNAGGGKHFQRGKPTEWEEMARYKQGDVVGLLLDFDRGTLTAYKNGERLGVTVSNAEVAELGVGPFC